MARQCLQAEREGAPNYLYLNCRLVELSLKGSNKITDDAAEPISSCGNLVVLDIQGTRIRWGLEHLSEVLDKDHMDC